MKKMKFTIPEIEKIDLTSHGQVFYWDEKMAGFGLCVGTKSKVYIAQKDIRGKTKRIRIGKHGVFHPENARRIAQKLLADMTQGIDPTAEKKKSLEHGITVAQAFEKYSLERGPLISPTTLNHYKNIITVQLADWFDRPLTSIQSEEISIRHKALKSRGPIAANAALQFLSTLYTYVSDEKNPLANPVAYMTRKQLWNAEPVRQNWISPKQFGRWYSAVMDQHNETIKDVLRFLAFTGMRKNEVFCLRWTDINFEEGTLFLSETKNKEALMIPLSTFLIAILRKRKESAGSSPWIFAGGGVEGHITNISKTVGQISEKSGVKFTLHDLRRTFLTTGVKLHCSEFILKRLVNHKIQGVTGGYIARDEDAMRETSERIAAELLSYVK